MVEESSVAASPLKLVLLGKQQDPGSTQQTFLFSSEHALSQTKTKNKEQ